MLKMKFDSRFEGFSDNFIIRCFATYKKLGNTVLETKKEKTSTNNFKIGAKNGFQTGFAGQ